MKIGIDISQIVYQTGVSRYTLQLVEKLLEIDQSNHYIFYAGSLRARQLIESFYEKNKTPKTKLVLTRFSPTLANWLWNKAHWVPIETFTGELDVFHSSDWTQPPAKAKKVTTVHDLSVLKFPQSHHSKVIKAHQKRLQWVKKAVDLVMADSQSTKRDLVELLDFNPEKIRVVYLAASEIFKPMRNPKKIQPILAKHGVKGKFIFNVGTLEPRKNLRRLIKAFKQVQLKHPQLKLVISGKFGWGEKVKPVKNVILTGFVPDKDLVAFYSGAQAFVYPSLYEGFGLPVLEALACGCPVITSKVSSLPEVAGEAALLVNPRKTKEIVQKIDQLVSSRNLRLDLKEKGLKQAKKFSWQKTAEQTLKIYEELVG